MDQMNQEQITKPYMTMFFEKIQYFIRSFPLAQLAYLPLELWQELVWEWTDQGRIHMADRNQRSAKWLSEPIEIAYCTVSAK